MKLERKLAQVLPSLLRHLIARNYQPYASLLRDISQRDDIWIASQGEYMSWWLLRSNAALRIKVCEGCCHVFTSLENGAIEKFPGEFLASSSIACPGTTFGGEVWITVDSALEKKDLLVELLRQEGILNFRVADQGEFMLSQHDVGELLEEISTAGRLYEEHIRKIRQVVVDKLAARGIPLLRIWYHPRANNTVIRAVFSVRHDVDRAITNLTRIRLLEKQYNASSTLYLRVFCPFYGEQAIRKLVSQPWCPEIALHGEFITHADKYKDEFQAARATKMFLEKLVERPILGVAMHGGEMSYNKSDDTERAMQYAGFLYDTTYGSFGYYLPFKKFIDGRISDTYTFPHALFDVNLLPFKFSKNTVDGRVQKTHSLYETLEKVRITTFKEYHQLFYKATISRMDHIYQKNGVFVLGLHPGYFGFFAYLIQPKNWKPLLKFMANYVGMTLSKTHPS